MAPGTVFLTDYLYSRDYPEMGFIPAGIIMTRVISRPTPSTFTLDPGLQGHCGGPRRNPWRHRGNGGHCHAGCPERGALGIPDCAPAMRAKSPPVGSELFVMPSHICPSTALYPRCSGCGTWRDYRPLGDCGPEQKADILTFRSASNAPALRIMP